MQKGNPIMSNPNQNLITADYPSGAQSFDPSKNGSAVIKVTNSATGQDELSTADKAVMGVYMGGTIRAGDQIYSSGSLQSLVDIAATKASVTETTTGFTATTNNCYWISLAYVPDEVFVNDIRAAKFPKYAALISTTYGPIDTFPAFAYDQATSRLYIYSKSGAPSKIASVKYCNVFMPPGEIPGPVTLAPGVWLRGSGKTATTVVNDGITIPFSGGAGFTAAVHANKYARTSDFAGITKGAAIIGAGSPIATTALVFDYDVICDCFISERNKWHNQCVMSTSISRCNSIEFTSATSGSAHAKGVLFIDTEVHPPATGWVFETNTGDFDGWVSFSGGILYGYPFIDGASNSFSFSGTRLSGVGENGETYTHPSAGLPAVIPCGSTDKHADKNYLLRFVGARLDYPTPSNTTNIALTFGANPGPVIFDNVAAACNGGPVGDGAKLSASEVAYFHVRGGSLPVIEVAALDETQRIPVGAKVRCLNSVSSSAGGAVLGGFRATHDDIVKDWNFVVEFSGTFAANANNKRLMFESGIVGSTAIVLDTTALAFNSGAWLIRAAVRKLDTSVVVDVEFQSGSTVLKTTFAQATYTVTSAQDMQFQVKGTAATNDVLCKSVFVRPAP